MHLIQDENGQMVHHGHTAGDASEHHCGGNCSSCASAGDERKEALALLKYMQKHNAQHAAELDRVAANLEKLDMKDVADQIRAAVSEFQKGNLRLSLAATLAGEHIKEV